MSHCGDPIPETPIGTLIIKYRPTITGANALAVLPGCKQKVAIAATLTGSEPKQTTVLTVRIGDASATFDQLATARSARPRSLKFSFTGQEMARLQPGLYKLLIESDRTSLLTLATVQVVAAAKEPTTWTIPQTLRVSIGQQYQLVKPVSDGNTLPNLTVSTSNKKVAMITQEGVLTAKKSGTATIKVRAADGSALKCKLMVVNNSFSRSKPQYAKGQKDLYTSTKRLYYEKGKLKAEIFVANTTGATVRNATGWTFELYDGETLIYHKPIDPLTFTLKHRKYGVYKMTITDEMLSGVSAKSLDLGSKRYQAVIRGENAVPLIASTKGAVQAKSTTFQAISGTIKSIQPAP